MAITIFEKNENPRDSNNLKIDRRRKLLQLTVTQSEHLHQSLSLFRIWSYIVNTKHALYDLWTLRIVHDINPKHQFK